MSSYLYHSRNLLFLSHRIWRSCLATVDKKVEPQTESGVNSFDQDRAADRGTNWTMDLVKAESSVSTTFKVERTVESFYAGGKVEAICIKENTVGSEEEALLFRSGSLFSLRSPKDAVALRTLQLVKRH